MTTPALTFQTRARAVDHLGREQIADSPTAISELWKNSYDAYARKVALRIFQEPLACAAIFDDGIGMNRAEFLERWLILGTEAKLEDAQSNGEDTNGLPKRIKQGQKGIGRLSVAFLGSSALILAKKSSSPFLASAIDWRLFENPYLLLQDIHIPVREFTHVEEFEAIYQDLLRAIAENVTAIERSKEEKERIVSAWNEFSLFESHRGLPSSASKILAATERAVFSNKHLGLWDVWSNSSLSGMALLIADLKDELAVWVQPGAPGIDDDEVQKVKRQLRVTLTGFVDPYLKNPPEFSYAAMANRTHGEEIILSSDEQFGLEDFHDLEHYIEGRFDEDGTFEGKVKAFGQNLGPIRLPKAWPYKPTAYSRVGPFDFCIGTFEQDPKKSSHPPEIHRVLLDKAERFSGLRVYRDGLRVMPYGRPDFDFFGIEERRTLHAGREFWQHKRVFGRLALTRADNPNLRDKAGREGLIDNSARRELQRRVVELLKSTARKYFGTDSPVRQERLPEIEAQNREARLVVESAVRLRTQDLVRHLKVFAPKLETAITRAKDLDRKISKSPTIAPGKIFLLEDDIQALKEGMAQFEPPFVPRNLGRLEGDYRRFRDSYEELQGLVSGVSTRWANAVDAMASDGSLATLRKAASQYSRAFVAELERWKADIASLLRAEITRIGERTRSDRLKFETATSGLIADVEKFTKPLAGAIEELDRLRAINSRDQTRYYGSYLRTVRKLSEDVNVDAALAWSADERAELEEELRQISSLAQIGITVEIIGHELEVLDAEIDKNLKSLPPEVKKLQPFKAALTSHQALMTRLNYLAPLRIAGPRLKEVISGRQIADYVTTFFASQFEADGILFRPTEAFLNTRITDFSYRIYPVFVTLVNNSIYWLRSVDSREIRLDAIDGSLIIADSGPGVDPDDEPSLFKLFFTRRAEGRGVGLFLARANLAASGHTIEYKSGTPSLPGANFIIHIKGS